MVITGAHCLDWARLVLLIVECNRSGRTSLAVWMVSSAEKTSPSKETLVFETITEIPRVGVVAPFLKTRSSARILSSSLLAAFKALLREVGDVHRGGNRVWCSSLRCYLSECRATAGWIRPHINIGFWVRVWVVAIAVAYSYVFFVTLTSRSTWLSRVVPIPPHAR